MPKLTDDQLADLLRETFTDHEHDSLPEATKRRPLLPVLIAAAAVLAVLGGLGLTVHRDNAPPVGGKGLPDVAATGRLSDAAVWAAAIRRIAQQNQPAGGWKAVQLYDAWSKPRTSTRIPVTPSREVLEPRGTRVLLDQAQQDQIVRLLGDLPSVAWRDGYGWGCPKDVAEVTVDPIVRDGTRRLVQVGIIYGCTTVSSATYTFD